MRHFTYSERGRMKNIVNFFGSMKMMAVLMLVFAVASGVATFIENDFGTMTAKAVVYNHWWFEVLLGLLAINLMINMTRFRMFQKKKALVMLFHLSFLIILLGAAVTRYIGYEGMMHIREGESENRITSSESYLSVTFKKGDQASKIEIPVLFSQITSNAFEKSVDVNGETVTIALTEYLPGASYTLVDDPDGKPFLSMMVTGMGGAQQLQMSSGDSFETADYVIDFESKKTFDKPVISISVKDGKPVLSHSLPLNYMKMSDQSTGTVTASESSEFNTRTLYTYNSSSFVLRDFNPSAVKQLVPTYGNKSRNMDALKLTLSKDAQSKEVVVFGKSGVLSDPVHADLGDMHVDVAYGAKLVELPFYVKLEDFVLDRYPGSMSPASYSSHVVVEDPANSVTMKYHIFMNHVLDYQGYRFFQSSYDQDELGTVLSVNHDPGTPITYIGYLLLGIGMFGALFMSNGRFRDLMKKANEASRMKESVAALFIVALSMFLTPSAHAQANVSQMVQVLMSFDKEHSNKFGELVVQDSSGRMKPMDTLSTEILHKLNRANSFIGLNANQVVLGMMMRPEIWREIKMIRTSHKGVRELLGIDANEKYASFSQFFEAPDELAGYKLTQAVEDASRKRPAERDKFDKAVLQVDERVNVAYMVYTGSLMRLWPIKDDDNNKWTDTISALQTFAPEQRDQVQTIAMEYFASIDEALEAERLTNYYKAFAEDLKNGQLAGQEQIRMAIEGSGLKGAKELISTIDTELTKQGTRTYDAVAKEEIAKLHASLEDSLPTYWNNADNKLQSIAEFQKKFGKEVYLEHSRIKAEILYNHADIFERLWPLYFIVGFILLLLSFLKILKPKFNLDIFSKVAFWLLVLFLIAHTIGLAIRWYISGHAPWSNGYESMIYIAWASVLAGFIFSKNSPITLAATGILTGLILFVAHLNWMDPQVTNLVPVLDSYWLSIHVSMITASYGFLGLGALLGFIVLILFIVRNKQNGQLITLSIKELNAINEMSLMIGLALLTVGNFLGGVWANESWGRYWGWDPKETWALVTILVYAVVVHLRFIKPIYNQFSFAVISLLSFTSVLMTYFGVNYYLAGMHSYAKGDPVPVPDFVPVTYAIIFAMVALAWWRKRVYE